MRKTIVCLSLLGVIAPATAFLAPSTPYSLSPALQSGAFTCSRAAPSVALGMGKGAGAEVVLNAAQKREKTEKDREAQKKALETQLRQAEAARGGATQPPPHTKLPANKAKEGAVA
eukprot:CAMPEP_0174919144 /NCGR_PEP_ID=MMETSP1355-20121228/3503_1 /TAXON_ID=464990 /ORGANISM="Hemiselmis tepida, Strain CCMP443" /LENGTH=115 /DNA_ID=CAMNT_0016164357 /DNA_START=284 /DNA_END=628 /DNA_ORIENTATION=+